MKVGKKIRNATLQDLFDASEYSSYSTNAQGMVSCKIGLLIFNKITDKTWECSSVSGIIPIKCNSITLDSLGGSRMKRSTYR